MTKSLGLENIGVETDKSGFIVSKENEQTLVPNIYAIGDVLQVFPIFFIFIKRKADMSILSLMPHLHLQVRQTSVKAGHRILHSKAKC